MILLLVLLQNKLHPCEETPAPTSVSRMPSTPYHTLTNVRQALPALV